MTEAAGIVPHSTEFTLARYAPGRPIAVVRHPASTYDELRAHLSGAGYAIALVTTGLQPPAPTVGVDLSAALCAGAAWEAGVRGDAQVLVATLTEADCTLTMLAYSEGRWIRTIAEEPVALTGRTLDALVAQQLLRTYRFDDWRCASSSAEILASTEPDLVELIAAAASVRESLAARLRRGVPALLPLSAAALGVHTAQVGARLLAEALGPALAELRAGLGRLLSRVPTANVSIAVFCEQLRLPLLAEPIAQELGARSLWGDPGVAASGAAMIAAGVVAFRPELRRTISVEAADRRGGERWLTLAHRGLALPLERPLVHGASAGAPALLTVGRFQRIIRTQVRFDAEDGGSPEQFAVELPVPPGLAGQSLDLLLVVDENECACITVVGPDYDGILWEGSVPRRPPALDRELWRI